MAFSAKLLINIANLGCSEDRRELLSGSQARFELAGADHALDLVEMVGRKMSDAHGYFVLPLRGCPAVCQRIRSMSTAKTRYAIECELDQ